MHKKLNKHPQVICVVLRLLRWASVLSYLSNNYVSNSITSTCVNVRQPLVNKNNLPPTESGPDGWWTRAASAGHWRLYVFIHVLIRVLARFWLLLSPVGNSHPRDIRRNTTSFIIILRKAAKIIKK